MTPTMSYYFDGGDINGAAVVTVHAPSVASPHRIAEVAHRFITDIIKGRGFNVPTLDRSTAQVEYLDLDNCWQVIFRFTKEQQS